MRSKCIRALVVALGLSTSSMRAPAQSPGFGVSVRPAIVVAAGDTLTLTYVVTVTSTARDSLSSFMVDAPGVLRVNMPGAKPEWTVGTRWRRRPVAEWGKIERLIMPGDSTPPLRFTARGLVDVVQYWAEVDAPLDSVITEVPPDSSLTQDTLVTIKGSTGFTIGVGALPADLSSGALVARLSLLIDRVCALGWIDNQGICNSLRKNAKAEAGPLGAMLNELNAQRGKHVAEAAYLLLSQNASYLLGRL